ncbi:MAG TPA: RHS repeat-associated core domain-containing protein [Thermoleophilaceae bacterium]|nr:RHS repeat-associated core domain-containing protein [Thermoleophilaceae bacterium]
MSRSWVSSSSSLSAGARLLICAAAVVASLLALGATQTAGQGAAPDRDGRGASGAAGPTKPDGGGGVASVAGDELAHLRTRDSRTFVHESGSRVTHLYQGAVNFRDGAGNWRPIDNELVPSAADPDSFQNAANRYRLSLPRDVGRDPVRMSAGGDWVDFSLRDAAGAATVDGSVATYRDVREGMALAYTATADGVKEEIRLDSLSAARDLVFDMRVGAGLTADMRSDGGVDVRGEDGRTRFVVAPPFMIDSAKNAEPSYAVSYELDRTATGYELAVRPDRQWLESPKRRWPVVIDPTTTMPNPVNDCFITEGNPNTANCYNADLEVGYDAQGHGAHDHRSLLRFPIGDSIPRGAVVLSAELDMRLFGRTTSNPVPVSVHTVKSSFDANDDRPWTSSVTWNTWNGSNSWSAPGGDFDATPLATTTMGGQTGWQEWFLDPHRVQELVQRSRTDNGFLLKSPGAAGPANYLQFASQDYDIADAPHLEIVWDERIGEKAEYTFERQRLSDRMELAVNVGVGNLMLTATDLQIAGTGIDQAHSRTWNAITRRPWSRAGQWWNVDSAEDVRLETFDDGSAVFFGPTGVPIPFHKTGAAQWEPSPGYRATLATEGAGHKLTFPESGTILHFRADGLLTEQEDRNGNAIQFAYTNWNALDVVHDTQGRVTDYHYNAEGLIEEISDPGGRSVHYEYDDDMLESYTDAEGNTTHYEYVNDEDLVEITDPRGNEIEFDYDGSHRVVSITRVNDQPYVGDGPTWEFDYDTGDVRCPVRTVSNVMTDPRGKQTVYCRDRMFRVVKTIDANGNERSSSYSATNRVLGTTAPGSAQTTMSYDGQDNLTSVDEPAGEQSSFEYNSGTHPYFPTKHTSPQGTGSVFAYDTAGNTTTIGDSSSPASQVEAKLEYNGQTGGSCPDDPTTKPGTLRCAIDGKGNQTLYGYDDDGNLTSVTPELPLGDTTMTYDSLSRLATVEDGKGQTRSYSYDALDRVTEIDYGGGNTVSFDYDANGNRIERIDSVHGTSTWEYDELNRRVEDDLPSGVTDYTWDAASNLSSLTDGGGTVSYRYDDVNRLMDLAEPGGSCTTPVSLCTTFGYTNRDQRERTTYPNGVEQTVTFDSSDKPTRVRAAKGATVLTDFTYDYEMSPTTETKLRQSVTDKDGNKTTYSYDFLDRLTSAVERNSSNAVVDDRSYDYDAASNRTSQVVNGATTSYAYNAANELCWVHGSASNAACNAAPSGAITFGHDLNGNMTTTNAGVGFAYNVRDQTTSFDWPGAPTTTFQYAGSGQSERTAVGGITQQNTLLGLSREGSTSWTRDPDGTLISQRASGGVRHYYLSDGLGSIVGLTDSTGALTRSYKYDPYGLIRATTGSTPNPFKFTGQYHEAQGNLYKIGARYYAPTLGRWTQQDPLDQVGDLRDGNRYVYAGADPINRIDPTGLLSFDEIVREVQETAGEVQRIYDDIQSLGRTRGGRALARCLLAGGVVTAVSKNPGWGLAVCGGVTVVTRGR